MAGSESIEESVQRETDLVQTAESETKEKPPGIESQTEPATPDTENDAAHPTEQMHPVDDKPKLQDQSNLLPMKQLIVVFAGLSCALFCQSSTIHSCKITIYD